LVVGFALHASRTRLGVFVEHAALHTSHTGSLTPSNSTRRI
jgi:hypothetical protein